MFSRSSILCCYLFLWLPLFVSCQLKINLDTSNGAYSVSYNGNIWLEGVGPAYHSSNKWYTSNTLANVPNSIPIKVISSIPISGTDALGSFSGTSLHWAQSGSTSTTLITSFKSYTSRSTIVFDQIFVNGLTDTATGNNTDIITAFPAFKLPSVKQYNYLSYFDTFAAPHIGHFHDGTNFAGGAVGGSPLIIYNSNLDNLVISPLTNFMVGVQAISSSLGSVFACGLQGKVSSIPPLFNHQTVIHAGNGIINTMYDWGSLLLAQGGKQRTRLDADLSIQYLQYWTDNGAYYYYLTEQGKNYADTITDVSSYVKSLDLPFRAFQFDSWWYFQNKSDGSLLLWEPRPDIFPNGMEPVDKAIGYLPLTLHNRYFSPYNDYINNFTFIIERKMALPIDENLFKYIMGKAQTWGLQIYEQDWLVTTYMEMEATQSNVSAGYTWLTAMGNAASSLGLTIQYCMPLPLHILQSTSIQSVTQVRATNDYQPGNPNWRIGYTSLFHWSVGVVPFKDDFWTTNFQSGCVYRSCIEPNPDLISIVATLSTGPVGPSDKIGYMNATRVMRSCRNDGLLLKPDRPMVPIESAFNQFDFSVEPEVIEAWWTLTEYNEGSLNWYYILGADLKNNFIVKPSNLEQSVNYKGVAWNFITGEIQHFSQTQGITLSQRNGVNGPIDFNYWVISPILDNGWVVIGEVGKYVTMAKQRVVDVDEGMDGNGGWVKLKIVGQAGEKVSFGFLSSTSGPFNVFAAHCVIGSSFAAFIHCSAGACTCTN